MDSAAADLIKAKEYRFLSPSILHHPKTREIMRLKGAGLVHNPNLYLTALASQEAAMPPASDPATATADLANGLARLLGLAPDATAEELLAKLKAALAAAPDPAKYMPVAAVQEMLRDRKAELSAQSEEPVTAKVERAEREHYIAPGMREWALSLCRSYEAAFDVFCEKSGPTFAYLFKPARDWSVPPETQKRQYESEMEATICEQLGLKPGALCD